MAIDWNEKLMATGSPEIDEEHREWLRRFNVFDAAVEQQFGIDSINSSLSSFIKYSNSHFLHEEALMDQYKCPGTVINQVEHNKSREKLQQIQTWIHLEENNLDEVVRLKDELAVWLVRHISVVDAQLRDVVVSDQSRSSENGISTLDVFREKLKSAFPGEFVEAILQSSPDVIVIVDEHGQIVFVSGRCQHLLGYEPRELLGKKIEVLVPGQFMHHTQMREKYQTDPHAKPMSSRSILVAQHKFGIKVPVDIALSPLPPISGNTRLVQAVIRDAMPRSKGQLDMLVQSVAMNAAANGIVLTDIQGVIQWVNPAVTRMTGYASSELIGKSTRLLKSGKHEPVFYKNLWQTVMSGSTWFGEIINRRKDGTLYYEEQHIAPVRNEDGNITRLIAIKQDVTARKMAEIKLEAANQELTQQVTEIERLAALLGDSNKALEGKVTQRTTELARANRQLLELDNLKSSFLGVISHELRTPFVSIIMSIRLLESCGLQGLTGEQMEMFQQLKSNIEAADEMIENLVNYASFVRKQGELRLTRLNMKHVVEQALLAHRFQAERKQQLLTTQIPADLPMLTGDEERLMDAVSQLVNNAIKYTGESGRVTVRSWQADNMLHLAVEDNGMGIPAEKLSQLWESFAQMADPLRRGREGLGLGLALVEYIIRMHHGKVWAKSQVGQGSTFGFSLPLDCPVENIPA